MTAPAGRPMLTVGITTRNRPDALRRCLESLRQITHLRAQVLVFDDASDEPVENVCGAARRQGIDVELMRDAVHIGGIAARNRLVDRAASPHVLLLDDDAFLLSPAPIERALAALAADRELIAVAFAQAEMDGRPWPAGMQPAPTPHAALVCAFIGFAHLVRRDAFLALGGYRAEFFFYGEEKDLCLRALQSGLRVLYLPDALVGHVPDPSGRTPERYVRSVIRNDVLFGLFNEPFALAACAIAVRLWRYRVMARAHGASGRFAPLLREIGAQWPAVRRLRRPVSWKTMLEWRRLGRNPRPYPGAA